MTAVATEAADETVEEAGNYFTGFVSERPAVYRGSFLISQAKANTISTSPRRELSAHSAYCVY